MLYHTTSAALAVSNCEERVMEAIMSPLESEQTWESAFHLINNLIGPAHSISSESLIHIMALLSSPVSHIVIGRISVITKILYYKDNRVDQNVRDKVLQKQVQLIPTFGVGNVYGLIRQGPEYVEQWWDMD